MTQEKSEKRWRITEIWWKITAKEKEEIESGEQKNGMNVNKWRKKEKKEAKITKKKALTMNKVKKREWKEKKKEMWYNEEWKKNKKELKK